MGRAYLVCRWVISVLLLLAGAASSYAQEGKDAFAGGQGLQPAHEKAAMIRLDAPVDDMMLSSIKRRVDVARKAGCSLIVFEVDTYGGQVTSAIEISKLMKKLPGEHINTVAWVHDKAYSAGALMSAACQQIVMSSQGSIGDCAPIRVENDELKVLPPAERAKIETPVTQEFENSADQNGLDKAILRAMVMTELEVHEMRNARTGETKFVDTPTKAKLLEEEADVAGGGKEKPWKYVKTVDDEKQLLTVGADLALAMKLSKATINSEPELKAALNVRGELILLEFNWAERATVFLTQTWVRFLLFVGMLVLAWVEASHPGISVAGIGAVICLVLLVGAPFLTGLAQVWEIALIVLGLLIILADVVIFGGVGMLAIPGFILMGIGLIASFVPAEPGGNWYPSMATTWAAMRNGAVVLIGGSFAAMGAFYVLAKYLYLAPGFNRLQLAPAGVGMVGGKSALREAVVRDATDRPADEAVFVGAMGRAATGLRPAGKGRFGEHLVNVVSTGGFIDAGREIEVIEVSGLKVVVKERVAGGLA